MIGLRTSPTGQVKAKNAKADWPSSPYREGDKQDKGQTADVDNESDSDAPLCSKVDWPSSPYREGDEQDKGQTADVDNESGSDAPPSSDYGEGDEQDQDIIILMAMMPLVSLPDLMEPVIARHQSSPLWKP